MRCVSCDTENVPDGRFCIACGKALARVCPACRDANPPSARFCSQCGTALETPGAAPAAVAPGPSAGELKQITVLFADGADSTSLIERLDPEEAGRRLAPAIAAMQKAVRRCE